MMELKPHWIVKLIGCSVSSISITGNEINIISKKGNALLNIGKIEALPTFKSHYFLVSIDIQGASYWGFKKKESTLFLEEVQRRWYLTKFSTVDMFSSKCKKYLCSRYVRTSKFLRLQKLATQFKSVFKEVPPPHLLTTDRREPFLFVEQLSTDGASVLARSRERFIHNETKKYAYLFDSVESNPLTEKQREACVVDNDNNLVLAGAGTGKTSTIVGKAGYLVESQKAIPSQILLLAYGNKAAAELQERINEKLKKPEVKASTFHKLGKTIIASVEKRSPNVSDLATDEKKLEKYIDDCLNELLKQPDYGKKAVTYFERYLYPDANPFDFKSKGEYLEFLTHNKVRSLKGDEVKSHGELLIANFLFVNGVEYQYEKTYEISTYTASFQQYRPDFFLSEYGIYLEHYGIDRNNRTAPYIDAEKYNAEIEWKRKLHNDNNTKCIETFHYEKQEGVLLSELENKLQEQGVKIEPMPEESVLETLREFGQIRELSKLLSSLLSNVKGQCSTIEQAIEIASSAKNSEQAMAALNLLLPILERYEKLLVVNHEIDFSDMIRRATQYVLDGKYKPEWKYILVDEFQDVASSRAALIRALRDKSENCVLFCVGDDWQSIYRFTGSDLSYTTQFGDLFGYYSTTSLDKTYRFNNSICDIASKFVTKNPSQVKKTLITNDHVDSPAVSILKRTQSCDLEHVREVLERISRTSVSPATVFVISRYNFLIDKQALKNISTSYPFLNISSLSMHGSKGKEADYVIVIGLERGRNGFPSEKVTHPLLELYLPPSEAFPNAEERRLLYVAITRARKRVYLIADMGKASSFMTELLKKDKYALCLDEFSTPIEQLEFESLKCPECETGNLTLKKNSKTGEQFIGCSNWSRCKYTEPSCPKCSNAMKHEGRFKVCLQCGWKVPMCKKCNGVMLKRPSTGHWGCSNYRGKDAFPTCTYQENRISFD